MKRAQRQAKQKPASLYPPAINRQIAWLDRLDAALNYGSSDWPGPFGLGADCIELQRRIRRFRDGLLIGARLTFLDKRK